MRTPKRPGKRGARSECLAIRVPEELLASRADRACSLEGSSRRRPICRVPELATTDAAVSVDGRGVRVGCFGPRVLGASTCPIDPESAPPALVEPCWSNECGTAARLAGRWLTDTTAISGTASFAVSRARFGGRRPGRRVSWKGRRRRHRAAFVGAFVRSRHGHRPHETQGLESRNL